MDKNGYPEEHELERIRLWDLRKKPVTDLLKYIEDRWTHEGYFHLIGKRVLRLQLSTGGWSGNEDIIMALQRNLLFWPLYWQKSLRGGHYYFRISLD